ncbi:MAG: cytochrome C class I protein [Alphaproteobacteria bacterium]|nr:MAG: cytochrome C class I protein [Alphaproteobacteria bacterium]
MKLSKIILVSIPVLIIAPLAFVYSGIFNIAATATHDPVTNWLLTKTRNRSIDVRSKGIEIPDLDNEQLQLAGINDFNSMCAGCHTAPGREPSSLARGLNPPAPDLAESVLEVPPEKLFWVTRNGIRMTGMPAWGVSHSDDEIWPVISFLQVLSDLDGEDYQEMLKNAEGKGHHAH